MKGYGPKSKGGRPLAISHKSLRMEMPKEDTGKRPFWASRWKDYVR